MERKVNWKENFIDVCEEYLEEVKAEYFMALGAYKQKLEDIKNESSYMNDHTNVEHLIQTILSMLAKRSTQGTEELEGFKPDIEKLEENMYENNLAINDEQNVSLDILKMYINYDLPEIVELEDISNIHKMFFQSNKPDYKPGKFRKKGDNNVMVKSSNKLFTPSEYVNKYLIKFIAYVNGYKDKNTITKVAMIHGILLGIHPFRDGNGRVARFIVDKMLSRDLNIPLFISEAINSRSNDSSYFVALDAFHLNNDSLPLIRYFYEVATEQLRHNTKLLNEYIKNHNKLTKKIIELDIKEKNASKLSDLLCTQTFIRRKEIINHLGITGPTANVILEKLINGKIIKKHKDDGRSKLYKFVFDLDK